MADADVQITAGSGTKIDTRTVGAGVDEHRQVVVIGDPATAANVATVDATFGLEVDVSRVVPGTGATNLGKAEDTAHADGDVGVLFLGVRNHYTGSTTDGDYSAISVSSYGDLHTVARRDLVKIATASTALTTATTAYTAGDLLNGGVLTFSNAARVSGGGGTIVGVTLTDNGDVIGAVDVLIFDANPTSTTFTDNAAFSLNDADTPKVVALVQLAGAVDVGANRIGQATNLAIPFVCQGSSSLFAALITRSNNAIFTANTDLLLTIYIERN